MEQVGHTGDVGEDVVAVKPDQRSELTQHLQDLCRHDQQ